MKLSIQRNFVLDFTIYFFFYRKLLTTDQRNALLFGILITKFFQLFFQTLPINNELILTRHRKQALSAHAPQHPRKLTTETPAPMATSVRASWPVITNGPDAGTVCSKSRQSDESRSTCSQRPNTTSAQPHNCNTLRQTRIQ